MTTVTATPSNLTQFEVGAADRAEQLDARAVSSRLDAARLNPIFGVVGSEFLAVATTVVNRHTDEISLLAERYRSFGESTAASGATFESTDATNADTVVA